MVEILVVIIVIAILAALLFPVYARVRARAAQTACMGNLRQIATAIRLYTDDSNGLLPLGLNGPAPGYPWWQVCWGYLKTPELLMCRSTQYRPCSYGWNTGNWLPNSAGIWVGPETGMGRAYDDPMSYLPVSSTTADPSTVLLADISTQYGQPINSWELRNDSLRRLPRPPHSQGVNVLFLHEQVKYFRIDYLEARPWLFTTYEDGPDTTPSAS